MAITSSAKKAHRQAKRRKVMNARRADAMRSAIKNVRTSVGSKDSASTLSAAYKAIDKAMKRGLIKKNTAARKKSRLAKLLSTTK